MKVKLPTSLRGWDRHYWNNRPVCLISAIEIDGGEIDIPSHLRCTKGHGNTCTHALPHMTSGNATKVTSTYIPASKTEVYINDANYSYTYSIGDHESTKGSDSVDWYEMRDTYNVRHIVTQTWGWNTKTQRVEWSARFTAQIEEVTRVKSGYKVDVHSWWEQSSSSGVGIPPALSRFEYARGGAPSHEQTGSRSTYAIDMEWDLTPRPWRVFFKFNEDESVWGQAPWRREIRDAMTLAFQNAFEQVPVYADNNIANAIELGSLVMDALKPDGWSNFIRKYAGKLKGIRTSSKKGMKALADLWLAYRYAYCTTKSDTRQAIDTASRKMITYMNATKFNGSYTWQDPYSGVSATCRCEFSIILNAANMLGMLHHYAQLRGVNLSGYKLWDLVPFSFMVDWFVDVGGMLKDQEMLNSYADYIFGNFWWSVKYHTVDDASYNAKVYSRWKEYYVPSEVIHTYNRSSGKTWLKRAGDAVALTVSTL